MHRAAGREGKQQPWPAAQGMGWECKTPEARKLDGRTSCLSLADGSVFILVRKHPSRDLYIKDSYTPVVVEIYIKLLQES
jgi:hypothetical protein